MKFLLDAASAAEVDGDQRHIGQSPGAGRRRFNLPGGLCGIGGGVIEVGYRVVALFQTLMG